MGVVLKVGTELVLVGSTWEGEAAAEPASLGGRGSCRAGGRYLVCVVVRRGGKRWPQNDAE